MSHTGTQFNPMISPISRTAVWFWIISNSKHNYNKGCSVSHLQAARTTIQRNQLWAVQRAGSPVATPRWYPPPCSPTALPVSTPLPACVQSYRFLFTFCYVVNCVLSCTTKVYVLLFKMYLVQYRCRDIYYFQKLFLFNRDISWK